MKRIAGKAALLTLVSGFVVGLAFLLLWMAGAWSSGSQALGPTTIGVDADPSGNQPTSLGTIDRCITAEINDTLYVDLFVTEVSDLRSFGLAVSYDADVLNVIGRDVNQFLLAKLPTGDIWDTSDEASEANPDHDGLYLTNAFDTQGADDGEGVLARLWLKVVGSGDAGFSSISLNEVDWNQQPPPEFGAALYDSEGDPIGSTDEDNFFEGPIYNAAIVVGAALDSDNDDVVDPCDNCPDDYNPLQEDSDQDGVGDACDDCPDTPLGSPPDANGCAQSQVDQDLDGYCDPGMSSPLWCTGSDNCPTIANEDQADGDNDGVGDACDNCPGLSDPDQTDTDRDGWGNPCDYDDDADGFWDDRETYRESNPLNPECDNASNDDLGDDDKVNDGCPNADQYAECDENEDGDCDDAGEDPSLLCANDSDDDGDGKVNDGCPQVGDISESNTPEVCDGVDNDLDDETDEGYDRSRPGGGPPNGVADCQENVDTDGDTIPNPTDLDDDFDNNWSDPDFNDHFSDIREHWMGTDSLDACPPPDGVWAPDFNNDGMVDIMDVLLFKPVLGSEFGGPEPWDRYYNRRFDLNADMWVDILDVLLMKPILDLTCE